MQKKMGFYVNTVMAVLVALLWGSAVFAGALTASRDTPARTGVDVAIGVASNTVIYSGSLVAINTSGYAVPASDTASYKVVGRAQATVDNSGTAGDGALSVNVRRGVFLWANGDSFTIADVGNLAYVEDDQTVQKAASATYDVVAGIIIDVDTDGVWVDSYAIGSQGAAALTTLTTSGNAVVGGTLDVTGASTFTAETTHNNGVDTDYVTTDAGAGVDTKTAGTLMIGASTADKVEVGDTGVETEVQGTLQSIGAATFDSTVAVTGVMTLTAAPKLTASTAAGAETVAMTNAPAAGDPVWANVTVGATTYVVPLFPKE
jgi:hypothetical protein